MAGAVPVDFAGSIGAGDDLTFGGEAGRDGAAGHSLTAATASAGAAAAGVVMGLASQSCSFPIALPIFFLWLNPLLRP